MAAAYEVRVSGTDDESFSFVCEWKLADGSAFPWADYAYAYELRGDCASLKLDQSTGITIREDVDCVIFAAPVEYRLRPGLYRHGCRITHIASGAVIQAFDGSITITEGNF